MMPTSPDPPRSAAPPPSSGVAPTAASPPSRKGPIERFLGLFTEVRADEGVTALFLTLNVFLILGAYYVLKTIREPLIARSGGAEAASYSSAGQAILLIFLVPLYGALAGRMNRRRLITTVTLVFMACLVAFFFLSRAGIAVGVPFFIWVGIFNVMIIAQFWAFTNDVYTPEEGKRLLALVTFGASAGAAISPWATGRLIRVLGVDAMFLVAGVLLALSLALTAIVDSRERARRAAHAMARPGAHEDRIGGVSAFRLLAQNRYLLLIAFLVLFLNWVNTNGEYVLRKTVTAAAHARLTGAAADAYIGSFYGGFLSTVNVVGLLVQLFLASRIIGWFGVRYAILILPMLALGGYALLAVFPVLAVVRLVKVAENATDYSLNSNVRNLLFLPTTRAEKYKGKQATDTIFWRLGDVLSAGLVFTGIHWLALTTTNFAVVNLVLAAVWLAIAFVIGRRFTRLTTSG
jgi:AAA family ATP:ADP antiporter